MFSGVIGSTKTSIVPRVLFVQSQRMSRGSISMQRKRGKHVRQASCITSRSSSIRHRQTAVARKVFSRSVGPNNQHPRGAERGVGIEVGRLLGELPRARERDCASRTLKR